MRLDIIIKFFLFVSHSFVQIIVVVFVVVLREPIILEYLENVERNTKMFYSMSFVNVSTILRKLLQLPERELLITTKLLSKLDGGRTRYLRDSWWVFSLT